MSVVVRGRLPGRDGTGDLKLDVAPASTARELIGTVVAAQLAGQGAAVWSDCSRLYLTDEDIAAMAAEGAVRLSVASEISARSGEVLPTVTAATARAVEAFRRGVFVMFAGASQVGGIDEIVHLQDGDRVVFLRLTALAGG